MNGYFLTATGTDIGKTFTSCALLHADPTFRAIKPVISGFDGEQTDTHQLHAAMNKRSSIESISPWRYRAPLAPDRAAAREGSVLPYQQMLDWCHSELSKPGTTLIEGVGGIMAPLDNRHTVLDWAQALNIPLLLVAGSYLGTISHTLTALQVIAQRGLTVRAIVVNESEESPMTLEELALSMQPHIGEGLLRMQPRVSSYREATVIHALAKELQ